MKAFNIEAKDSMHIIDAVNEVSNHFAVSSADLATNIGKVSASLAVNGVKYEELLGMMTAITEVTRNASTASRGLNMISSRLVQVLDDSSSTGKKLTKIYEDLGIALKDDEGQMRSTYDILKDLAKVWDSLSGDQQKYIALTSAGARQTQNFVALMKNFNTAVEATAMAYDSVGSAARENERVMDSISKKVEILRSEFQQLVIGDGGLQQFAKNILDIGIEVLTLIDNLGGLPAILSAITVYIVAINALNIYKSLHSISGAIQNIIYALPNALAAWRSYAAGVVSANTAMQASIPIIGWVSAAIGLLVGAVSNYNKHLEEQKQKIRENITAFSDEYKALEESQKKLKDENISREELNSIIDSNLDEYEAERLKLLGVNEAREETIRLIEEEKKARAQELVDTGLSEYEESLDKINNGYKEAVDLLGQLPNNTAIAEAYLKSFEGVKTADEQIDALVELKNKLLELRKNAKEGSYEWHQYDIAIQQTEAALTTIKEAFSEDSKIVKLFNDALRLLGLRYDANTQTIKKGSEAWGTTLRVQEDAIKKTQEAAQSIGDELERLKQLYNITTDDINAYIAAHEDANLTEEEAVMALIEEAEAVNELEERMKELKTAYENSKTAANTLVSNLNAVSSALNEQEKQNSLSIETQLKLIDAGYGLALAYDEETGACTLNTEAVAEMAKAKISAEIAAQKVAQSNLTSMLLQEAKAATTDAKAFLLRAQAMNASATADYAKRQEDRGYTSSISGYGSNWGYVAETESRQMYDAYSKTIEALQSQLDDFDKNGVKAFKNIGDAAKNGSKALDSQGKALDNLKSKYEEVISWISKQYDAEIDKIQKAKDEAIKAEEAKIKAKEKEKDAALDAIEKEIQALEKQKKALKEQKEALDDRKQALKDEEDILVKSIEKNIKALEKERDALIKPVEERIKVLEKERDAIIDSTQTEIDALQELKEERQTYWDEQINALKEANKELKDNLELQEKLDALEKAKNTKVKVYKEGQGFVYDVDQNAVQQAQKALDEYLSEKAYEDELARLENLKSAEIKSYDDRINELTKYKDNTKKIYDQQINDLKEYKESVKENYDEQIEALKAYKETVQEEFEAQIELINQDIDALEKHMDELDKHKESLEEHKDAIEAAYEAEIAELEAHKQAVEDAYETEIQTWEKYKQEFENMVEAYEKEQNKLLFEQLTGIKSENSNWMTRLDNLAKFVNEYNKLQQRLETGDTNVQNTAQFSNGTSNINTSNPSSAGTTSGNGSLNSIPIGVKTPSKPKYDNRGFRLNYASGISSISNDQIGIVGENPNQELVIGSKLNGQAMMLNKGTGIVNADSTKTLASILNQVGKFGASGFGSGNGTLNNNYNNDSLVINGVTIQGANIKDPQTFVNSLLNLKAEALQRAYKHR